MFITHPGSVAQFGPEKMKDLKVVPLPQAGRAKPVTHFYGFALTVNPDIAPERQRAAHELMRFLVQNPKEWLAGRRTHCPSPGSSRSRASGPSVHRHVRARCLGGPAHDPVRVLLEIADAMHRAVQRIVLNRVDVKRSLDQACQEIDLALSKS